MSNTDQVKSVEIDKIEALRKHMLLTVDSMVKLYGITRVTYYNWLRGKAMRKSMAEQVRKVTRQLVTCVSKYNWPYDAVFVANQAERLKMLQDLVETLDKPATE